MRANKRMNSQVVIGRRRLRSYISRRTIAIHVARQELVSTTLT